MPVTYYRVVRLKNLLLLFQKKKNIIIEQYFFFFILADQDGFLDSEPTIEPC